MTILTAQKEWNKIKWNESQRKKAMGLFSNFLSAFTGFREWINQQMHSSFFFIVKFTIWGPILDRNLIHWSNTPSILLNMWHSCRFLIRNYDSVFFSSDYARIYLIPYFLTVFKFFYFWVKFTGRLQRNCLKIIHENSLNLCLLLTESLFLLNSLSQWTKE